MDRRKFTRTLLTSVASFAFMDTLIAGNALSWRVRPITDRWVITLNEYCGDLRKEAITPAEWQNLVEGLYKEIDLAGLLRFINYDDLIRGFEYPDLGVETRRVVFPRLEGLPDKTFFVKKIFGMQKDRAIIPHGHSNMSSAHLVLHGEMHLRNYDKITSDKDYLVIRPTVDRTIVPGQCSTISDERNNIHWFIANTETTFTFDVIMLDLGGADYDIHNLDINAGEDLHDGTLRVPLMDVEEALKKYGKAHH